MYTSKTGAGVTAYSMLVAVDSNKGGPVWVRVNVFGSLAKKCSDKIDKGDYVLVNGEMMERKVHENDITLLEVRAKEIVFGSTMRQKSFVKEAVEKAESVTEINE
jgi:single-stranded DNA-binding protein